MENEKSLCITYVLWLFLGYTGIHHFYLGRDKQAFVWWSTWGGFWFGWLRDLWRIPQYVDEANQEQLLMDDIRRKIKLRREPLFSVIRFAGELCLGYYYSLFVRLALPEGTPLPIVGVLICLGVAIGVYMVGSIGLEDGPFLFTYFLSLLCYFVLTFLQGEEGSYMYVTLAAACYFNYYRKHKAYGNRRKKNIFIRISHLSFGATIIFTLWTSFLYFNAAITYKDGEKIQLRDAVNHFFKSPAWLDFKKTMWDIYGKAQKQGWRNIYHEFVTAFDPTGETNAYKVLDVTSSATTEEVRKAYKKLVIQWHPDRYKGDDKEGAQKRFMEIQKSYEILSKRRKRSTTRTEKDRSEF